MYEGRGGILKLNYLISFLKHKILDVRYVNFKVDQIWNRRYEEKYILHWQYIFMKLNVNCLNIKDQIDRVFATN